MTERPVVSATSEAPCRADFAGGTLDIWPLGVLHPGSLTVNAAIPVTVHLTVDLGAPEGEVQHSVGASRTKALTSADASTDLTAAVVFFFRPQGGVRVRVESQASVGSGLGGSSAYAVALSRGLLGVTGTEVPDERLVPVLRDLEARVLRAPTGVQDYWSAITGGVSAIHLEPGGERIERLDVDPGWVGERATVFDTGISHHSGMVNWQIIRRRLEGERATIDALEAIAGAATDCCSSLVAGDAAGVARAMSEEWTHRRRLAPEVSPVELVEIERAAAVAGAAAFKACGAGGGGSVLLWHAPESRDAIVAALRTAAPDGRVVATGIAGRGCRVTLT
ncbi:MAG: hypothetical protein QNL88_01630 [Acidobacteriota bacterium]|nr:hypothetical protein [Acidobacteriota bacterium]